MITVGVWAISVPASTKTLGTSDKKTRFPRHKLSTESHKDSHLLPLIILQEYTQDQKMGENVPFFFPYKTLTKMFSLIMF